MQTILLSLPYQSSFSIATDCGKLVHCLRLKYGIYVKVVENILAEHHIVITKSEAIYLFATPEETYQTATPIREIDKYIFEKTNYSSDVFALHGAAVEWKGKGYIFLAPTTSGKTTLTCYLSNYGFGYLTDDCVLLDRSDFLVHPCATPIQLREGGVEVLEKYQLAPKDLQILEEPPFPHRFVYTPTRCVKNPTPLANIYFIERTKKENCVIDMSTTERITALMKAPIINYSINLEHIRFISQLAKTNCYRLLYSDMGFVKEVIQNG